MTSLLLTLKTQIITGMIGLGVNMGFLPGFSTVDKFGINPEITTGSDPEDVIEQGGQVQYDPNGSAPIKYVSSSSALDVGQTVEVQGLDINGILTTQDVITNGQNNVELDTPLWRQFRMQNNDSALDIQGTLYCHTDPAPALGVPTSLAIRTIIIGSKNQTLFAAYTIPAEKVGFLFRGELGVELDGNAASLSEYAHCHYESRRFGKLFKVKKAITVFPGYTYQDKRSFPDVIPGKTDIKFVAETVTQTMGLFATFDILLVDASHFSPQYLSRIGQPGY